MSKKKEPAMSEFKVGDWVKRTDKITESIYQISSIDKDLIKCNFIKNGENWRLHTTKGEIEHATPEEIAAGHRIDKPSNPRELETLDKPENHISPNCKVGMFEMDKCREEFEKWLDDNNMFMNIERRFDQESNTYDYCAIRWIWESWQHQQAKVEELQRRNQMLNDNIKEQGQKLVYQNEVIETQAEKLLGLRDEKAELQKRVDKAIRFLVEAELYQSEPNIDLAVKALKGEG